MLRKHTNDGSFAVDVKNLEPVSGPCDCPQTGCQSSGSSHPYSKGNVVYEEFGGYSGDYVTSLPCKCCDGKGRLYEGEIPYKNYCLANTVRDLRTGYPEPYPMSRKVYEDADLVGRISRKDISKPVSNSTSSGGCYVATSIYGSYDSEPVLILRRFRDEYLLPYIVGRLFVRIYYTTSPVLVKLTVRFSQIRAPLKFMLDRLVNFLRKE